MSDPGARFENFMASQLLKAITLWNDRYGSRFELFYIRTYDDQEVDFLITESKKPWLLIEAKNGSPELSNFIKRLKHELSVPAVIVTNQANWNSTRDGIELISAERFLSVLP